MRRVYSNQAEDHYSGPFSHLNTQLGEECQDGTRSCVVSHNVYLCGVQVYLVCHLPKMLCFLCSGVLLHRSSAHSSLPSWNCFSVCLPSSYILCFFLLGFLDCRMMSESRLFFSGIGFFTYTSVPQGFQLQTLFNYFEFQALYLMKSRFASCLTYPSCLLFCYLPHLWVVLPSPCIQSWNVVLTSWGKSWLSSFPPGLEFSFQNDFAFVSSVSTSVVLVTCPQQCSDVWLPPLHRRALWCCGAPVLLARKCVFRWAPSGFFLYLLFVAEPLISAFLWGHVGWIAWHVWREDALSVFSFLSVLRVDTQAFS